MNITPLIPQQVFDNALFGIRAQGYRRSTDQANGKCQYRGSGGTKCGIGFSIPDSVYTPDMDEAEYVAIERIDTSDALAPLRSLFEDVDIELLDAIQKVHDVGYLTDDKTHLHVAGFEDGMAYIATEWNLTYTPPEVPTMTSSIRSDDLGLQRFTKSLKGE